MRAFLGTLDRELLIALIGGLAVGAIWAAWTGPGFVLASLVLIAGIVGLLIRRRWLEVGALMLGAGLVPAIVYRALGAPDPGPRLSERAIPVEYFAPAAADLLVLSGTIALLVTAALGISEGRHRERQEARHLARKRRRLEEQ